MIKTCTKFWTQKKKKWPFKCTTYNIHTSITRACYVSKLASIHTIFALILFPDFFGGVEGMLEKLQGNLRVLLHLKKGLDNTKIQGKIWLELEFNTCTQIIIVKCTTTTKNWWKYSKAIFHFKVYRHLGLWGGEGASTRVNALGTPYTLSFLLDYNSYCMKIDHE